MILRYWANGIAALPDFCMNCDNLIMRSQHGVRAVGRAREAPQCLFGVGLSTGKSETRDPQAGGVDFSDELSG